MLRGVDDQWWALQARLEEAEEETLQRHFEALHGWFGLQRSDLSDRADGGLRSKVRGRVHRLVLAPLAERMRQEVDLAGGRPAAAAKDGEASSCSTPAQGHVLDMLLDCWEQQVEPLVDEAGTLDERLARRARRKAQFGAVRDAMQVEAKERPAAWAPARGALEALAAPLRRLAVFAEAEVSPEATARLVAMVPAIAARAACDFYFQGYAAEFEQLENWWDGAKSALMQREGLWDRLLEEEGLFVRRIERGIEALRAARHRYKAFADFGASEVQAAPQAAGGCAGACPLLGEWPGEAVSLLANAISDFRKRLRPIRDCAAWRVVEAAKSIHRQLRAASPGVERPQWELVSRSQGAAALQEVLDAAIIGRQQGEDSPPAPAPSPVPGGADPVDTALVFTRRLDGIMALLGDLRDSLYAEAAPGSGGAGDVLQEVLQAAAGLSEELLAVMDEPTVAGVDEWTRRWCNFGQGVGGQRVEAAMLSMPQLVESSMSLDKRRERRQRLALLRGVQVLLDDPAFGARLIGLPAAAANGSSSIAPNLGAQEERGVANVALTLSMPPADTVHAAESPRGGYLPRRPRRESEEPSPCKGLAGHASPAPAAAAPAAGTAPAAAAAAAPAAVAPMAAAEGSLASPAAPTPTPQAPLAEAAQVPVEAMAPATPTRAGLARGSQSETPRPTTRPATPSWLLPPWPRPATPSAGCWTRPDTPSTACDDAEVTTPMPRWKFVNGEYVQLRPVSSHSRLPPLQAVTHAPRQAPAAPVVW